MAKIGTVISRIRNVLKNVKEDPFMTDRFIYSLILKYGATLMYRDTKMNSFYKNNSLFKEIPCLELIEVDRVEACCAPVKTSCTFMRSKNKLPKILNLHDGPIIRAVTSIDYSEKLHMTTPSEYILKTKSTSFKYNTTKYYWIVDGYLFVANAMWEGVRIQAIFEESVSSFLCNISGRDECVMEQDRDLDIPEYLFTEIENMIRQELFPTILLPQDGPDDSQNAMR